jgi:hypothetical protein
MAKKQKNGKGAADDTLVMPAAKRGLSLADHPKATRQIRTGRAWGALLGFAAMLVLSLRAGRPMEDALARALQAGIGSYLVAWAVMVIAWRQLAQAEIEHARKRIVAALLEMEAAERGGSSTG